jgi:hypothetical protein
MDINCTLNCIHQNDGKCTLTDLSTLSNVSFDDDDDAPCPYMQKKSNGASCHGKSYFYIY